MRIRYNTGTSINGKNFLKDNNDISQNEQKLLKRNDGRTN